MTTTSATKSSVRRGDYVTLNSNVTSYNTVVTAGTKCRVWKAKRDGTLYTTPENAHYNLVVRQSDVTKAESPKANVNVGDIFSCSWGYEQTNVDFYKIVAVLPNSVKYVSIGETRNYNGPMSGECMPNENAIGTDVKTARIKVETDGSVHFKISSYSTAFPWNGKPQFFSEWH